MDLNIRLAQSDADIDACGSVMRELRPHVPQDRFLALVRDQEPTGYRLAMASTAVDVVAAAGFRIGKNLAWGKPSDKGVARYVELFGKSCGYVWKWSKKFKPDHFFSQLIDFPKQVRPDATPLSDALGLGSLSLYRRPGHRRSPSIAWLRRRIPRLVRQLRPGSRLRPASPGLRTSADRCPPLL